MSGVELERRHLPVMSDRIAELARGRQRAVDATAGAGGHAAILLDAGCEVLAIDADPEAAAGVAARFAGRRCRVLGGRFADPRILQAVRAFQPELVLLDLGVASFHLDTDARGFSFRPGVPLDMRFDPRTGPTAADILNRYSSEELARVFREGADEPRARRLAAAIVRRRTRQSLATSDDLVKAIREVLGPRSGPADFARLFQAVRLEVNQELAQLRAALPALRDSLLPGGALAAISYHSGEDRLVKRCFADWSRSCVCPPGQPVCTCRGRPLGALVPRRAIRPGPEELAANPRARSARLRVFVKADAP